MSTATTFPTRARHRGLRQLLNLALVLIGVGVTLFGVARMAEPHVTCRSVEMHPGDVCRKNDYSRLGSDQVQTYEQRLRATRQSQPVVVATGLGMAAFGLLLLRQESRRARED